MLEDPLFVRSTGVSPVLNGGASGVVFCIACSVLVKVLTQRSPICQLRGPDLPAQRSPARPEIRPQMVTAASGLLYLDLPFPVNPDREAKAEARWRYSTAPTPSTGNRLL